MILKWLILSYIRLIKYSRFCSITLFGVELPHPLQMNIQLRKLHLLIQHFMILELRHTCSITQSLKEIHSGCETALIDTGTSSNHRPIKLHLFYTTSAYAQACENHHCSYTQIMDVDEDSDQFFKTPVNW